MRCAYCARIIWPWQHYVLASKRRWHMACREHVPTVRMWRG